MPGNIHSFKSVGTHALIKEGAKLVVHAGDVLEEFLHFSPAGQAEPAPPACDAPTLTEAEAMVMNPLEPDPIHIDDLARKLEFPSGRLAGLLLQLELKGLVVQSPGKRFASTAGLG